MSDSFDNLANFIFEVGMLERFKRSGLDFLGTGKQNIASHGFRTSVIGYTLASKLQADVAKTVLLCLFHDLPETRTGDINVFQAQYVKKDEKKAVDDMFRNMPNPEECGGLVDEFNCGESFEAEIARDADVIELIFTLKEELDNGNNQADVWIKGALTRLKLNESIELVNAALKHHSMDWWYKK